VSEFIAPFYNPEFDRVKGYMPIMRENIPNAEEFNRYFITISAKKIDYRTANKLTLLDMIKDVNAKIIKSMAKAALKAGAQQFMNFVPEEMRYDNYSKEVIIRDVLIKILNNELTFERGLDIFKKFEITEQEITEVEARLGQ